MSTRRRTLLIGGTVAPLLVALLIVGVLFDGYQIPSSSMDPTLSPGDRVLVRSVDGAHISRGDVIVFSITESPGVQPLARVGRVVAVAGDRVGEEEGFLTVNDKRSDEPYLPQGTTTAGIQPTEVPVGHVFVMGDNRANSQDSRLFGPVPTQDVEALVALRWWPLNEVGGV